MVKPYRGNREQNGTENHTAHSAPSGQKQAWSTSTEHKHDVASHWRAAERFIDRGCP
jgi:hypothetical protein